MDIHLISDLHFGHSNIIKYCRRPFRNSDHMDIQLIKNWNRVVGRNDLVYYLGDFAMRYPKKYLKKLNGTVFFILGNHDKSLIRSGIHPIMQRQIISYRGENILLVHDPRQANNNHSEWQGWVIHGHTHNNEMEEYPMINHSKKTINVSCELHAYTPVKLSKLLKIRGDL